MADHERSLDMSVMVRLFSVKDMKCSHCKKIISNEVSQLDGIEEVDTDLRKKTCKVTYDDAIVADRNIARVIRNLGYSIKY